MNYANICLLLAAMSNTVRRLSYNQSASSAHKGNSKEGCKKERLEGSLKECYIQWYWKEFYDIVNGTIELDHNQRIKNDYNLIWKVAFVQTSVMSIQVWCSWRMGLFGQQKYDIYFQESWTYWHFYAVYFQFGSTLS